MGRADHVAIAVHAIDETSSFFRTVLRAESLCDEHNEELGVRFVLLRCPGLDLELMAPSRADSVLQGHLDSYGPGFHHMAFGVEDRPSAVMEPRPELLLCVRPDDRTVRLMDNLVHSTNDAIRERDDPLPEGLLRSRRQEEILALLLTEPETEFPLSALARRLAIPYSSVHREIERAERFGVVTTRRFESLRMARANVDSPYFPSLAALLRR